MWGSLENSNRIREKDGLERRDAGHGLKIVTRPGSSPNAAFHIGVSDNVFSPGRSASPSSRHSSDLREEEDRGPLEHEVGLSESAEAVLVYVSVGLILGYLLGRLGR